MLLTENHKVKIEEARKFWAKVAKKNGWYKDPFFVQVWFNEDGSVNDSVSTGGMTTDIIYDHNEVIIPEATKNVAVGDFIVELDKVVTEETIKTATEWVMQNYPDSSKEEQIKEFVNVIKDQAGYFAKIQNNESEPVKEKIPFDRTDQVLLVENEETAKMIIAMLKNTVEYADVKVYESKYPKFMNVGETRFAALSFFIDKDGENLCEFEQDIVNLVGEVQIPLANIKLNEKGTFITGLANNKIVKRAFQSKKELVLALLNGEQWRPLVDFEHASEQKFCYFDETADEPFCHGISEEDDFTIMDGLWDYVNPETLWKQKIS